MKTCSKCNKTKNDEEFEKHRRQCKKCRREIHALWQKKNPEKCTRKYHKMRRELKSSTPKKMCKNHPGREAYANGLCPSCYNRQWLMDHPEKAAELREKAKKRWAEKYAYGLSEENKNKKISRELKCRYGITIEDYQDMIINQNNKCYICGVSGEKPSLYIDHCHKTGKVRKLICPSCNIAVRIIEKGEEYVKLLYKYIEDHSA